MKIIALDLENTKSYAAAHVDFADGVNAIVGHNGAGKSTILEAIGFALFDSLGYKQDDFVREGAKTAQITVTFRSDHDERAYQVVRRCGSSNQHYIYDPELDARVCEGKADVLAFLRLHMGTDANAELSRLFSDAVGVPQGTLTSAFLQTPAARKSIFDPLLQVEEYKRAHDRLLDPLRTLRDGQQALDLQIADLRGRLERLPHLEEAVASRAQEVGRTQSELGQVEKRLVDVQDQRQNLEATQKELDGLRREQTAAERTQALTAEQRRAAEQQLGEAQRAQAIVAETEPGRDAYLAAQTQQQQLESQQRERARLDKQRSQIDKSLAVQQAEQSRIEQQLGDIEAAEARVEALANDAARQTELESALAEARQQRARLDDAQAEVKRQQKQVETLRARLQQTRSEAARAAELETTRSHIDERVQTLRVDIDECSETMARHKARADELKRQNEALTAIDTATCPVCEQPLDAEHRAELLARNETLLATMRVEYNETQRNLKAHRQTLEQQESERRELEKTLRRLPGQLAVDEAAQLVEAQVASLAEGEARAAALSDAATQIDDLARDLAALGNPRQQQAIAQQTASQRATVEAQQKTVVAKLVSEQETLAALQSELAQFADLDAQIDEVAATLAEHQSAYQRFLAHEQVAQSVESRAAEVERLTQAQQEAEETVAALTSKITKISADFDAAALQRLRTDEQLLGREQGALSTRLELLQKEQARDEREIETLKQQQVEQAAAQAQRDKLATQQEYLETLRRLIREAGPYITRALIGRISGGAAQIFSELMQDYSRVLRWTEDYGIAIEAGGHERMFAQLSGGEQMSAALAVRLSLLREMSNISIAFFDEPTTNLDEARREALVRQILAVQGFRQLFVISHDDTFEQATQNLIRVRREGGQSEVVEM